MGNSFLSLLAASWAAELRNELKIVLLAVFTVLGVVAIGYSVFLMFLLAKAKNDAERQTAKKRILNTIAGLVVIILLTGTFVGWDLSGFLDRNPAQDPDGDIIAPVIPPPPDKEEEPNGSGGDPTDPPDEDEDDEEPEQYERTPKIEDCYYNLAYPLHLDDDTDQDASFRSTILNKFDKDDHPAVDFSRDPDQWSTFTVHAIADGTITKIVREDPDWGTYVIIQHDETIHSHNVHKRTIRRITGPTAVRGPAPAKPRLGDREVHPESGWEEDENMGEGGKTWVYTVEGVNFYIWHWRYEVGREVWQYAHSIYKNLHPGSINEQIHPVDSHIEAGQFFGFANTDSEVDDETHESNALHIELVLYGDDIKSAPSPNSIPDDEGRVDLLLYTKSEKTEIPVPAYEDKHWTDGPG